LISGYSPPLRALERALADWEESESALVFNSGYCANLAILRCLTDRQDIIFSDELNHASLIDGCRLAGAQLHIYRHRDVAHLEDLIRQHASRARRRLIVTDSVFSMDGDFARLKELCDLAERYDCLLLIDEAHATGVIGANGRGLSESLLGTSFSRERLIKIGTLSKALGTQGGFVCGSRLLIDWLVNSARPYIYSTALAPPIAAAARRAITIVRGEPGRRRHVLSLAKRLREELIGVGFPASDSQCQIVPILVGAATETVALSRRLRNHGFLVPAIRPPSVPDGTARLRISLTASHKEVEILHLVKTLRSLAPTRTPH
jgi:8-amino-7-oxononanoate synthase